MLSLSKPLKHDKWLIFPNSSLSSYSCDNSIYSKCVQTDNVYDCLHLCRDGKDPYNLCDVGIYDSKTKNCIPLQSSLYPKNNPIYESIPQDGSYIYFNTEVFPFPPDNANAVFYYDKCVLHNIETNTDITISNNEEEEPILQILPIRVGKILDEYRSVYFNEIIGFKIPDTTLILRPNEDTSEIKLEPIYSRMTERLNNFVIKSIDEGDKKYLDPDTEIYYGKPFYLSYLTTNTVIYKNGKLQVEYGDYQTLKHKGENATFLLKSNMNGYYCENNQCKSIPLNQTETNKVKARYQGQMVFSSGCLGQCKTTKNWWWIIGLLIMGIVIIMIVMIIKKKGFK